MKTKNNPNAITKHIQQILSIAAFSVFLFIPAVSAQAALRANGKIAFTSDRDGNREIYVMNADGSSQTRITNNSISDDHPTWSPNGKRIAFISQRQTGEYAIFLMNADGTGKTEITTVNYQPSQYYGTGWTISWSPDGSRLVFVNVQGNVGSLYIVNADGTNRRFLTNGYNPAWSPDGAKILFIRGAFPWTLHTIKPDGTDLRTLPPLPNYYNWYYDATWSPTGSEIAITAFDAANEVIFIANADGSNPREFHSQCSELSLGCSRLAAPSWSPDGRSIAFLSWGLQSGIEIYVKDIAGGESRRLTDTGGNNSDPSWQPLAKAIFDFDGDSRSDISVFRPSAGEWWYLRSSNGETHAAQFGNSSDKITPADFTGDGKTDIAVWRSSTGEWFILRSEDGSFYSYPFGTAGDIPAVGDFDADGKADTAVFRPSSGTWFIRRSSDGGAIIQQFGTAGDVPLAADYDGDGRSDIAVYRPSAGEWWIERSSAGTVAFPFGTPSDKPVPGDYTGDGKTDASVFRPASGEWFILRSENQTYYSFPFGISTDTPAPADYDGDGRMDAAVFRDGVWYLLQTTGGVSIQQFGLAGDKPIPSAILP